MTDPRPKRVGEVWIRKEGDQTAVYDASTGRLFRLNPSALAIWELCDGETHVGDIVHALIELTGKSEPELMSDVHETLDQLRLLGLIIERTAGA